MIEMLDRILLDEMPGTPGQEQPCWWKIAVGECAPKSGVTCKRCAAGKGAPQGLLKAIKDACAPALLAKLGANSLVKSA